MASVIRRVAMGFAAVNPVHAFNTHVMPYFSPSQAAVDFGEHHENTVKGSDMPHHIIFYDDKA